jgi:hypothetical protein
MTPRRILPALAGVMLMTMATPGHARQAISVSLVECGAIFDELAQVAHRRGRDLADVWQAEDTAERFRAFAITEARREGVRDVQAHINDTIPVMAQKWTGRFASILLLTENKDWIDYCGALGKDRGVLPLTN